MYSYESFSHIYIEKQVLKEPKTAQICAKLPSATIVEIEHYKDVFNRSINDFREQKKSTKLILAKKPSPFLYPITELIQDQKQKHFYYSSFVLNCLYDCHYCFLQGMYPSAYVVVFVNVQEFIDAIIEKQKEVADQLFVSISYDTDLLLFEKYTGFITDVSRAVEGKPISLEVRTKSGNIKPLLSLPKDNLVFNVSLSPEIIVSEYEKKTAPLASRLKAINEALEYGLDVGIVFDPIIYCDDFFAVYTAFFKEVFSQIEHQKISRFVVGTFRMNTQQLKKIRKKLQSDIVFYPYESHNDISTYSKDTNDKMYAFVKKELAFLDEKKIDLL